MVDTDVRLGLTGSDLAIRDRQFRKDLSRFEQGALNPDISPEFKALVDNGFAGEITATKRQAGQDFISVRKDRIVEILTLLRDHPGFAVQLCFRHLGVDLLGFDKEPRFEVIYSLYSIPTHRRIVIKAEVDEDDPTIDTVVDVWRAAEWPEREIFDLFGIEFNNHPDMRRIMMPDDWVGHPLRKDFPLGGEEVEFSHNVRDKLEPSMNDIEAGRTDGHGHGGVAQASPTH
jgi:NADH-quinone oxidoreductase subunit C